MISRRLYALFGLLATVFGMAVGHLTAALIHPDSSPVLAVGSAVIDSTPASLKEWAIKHFESNGFSIGPIDFAARNYDKVVLVGSVLVGVLVLAAVAGILTRRRFEIGGGMLAALVLVAAAAALTRSGAVFVDVVPSILTLIAGVGALWVLHRTANDLPLDPRTSTPALATPVSTGSKTRMTLSGSEEPDVVTESSPTPARDPQPSRRGVLIAMGALAAAATVIGGAGKWIIGLRARPEDIALPAPVETAPAFPAGLDKQVPGITPLRVSNADFYRVDTRLDTPVVSSADWKLTVDGDVGKKLEISFEELLAMGLVERDITLTCVSNSVGGKYVGAARWLGVPLMKVLDQAGIGDQADQMLATDFDGMQIGTPLDLLTDGREPLIAVGMNGEPLPREHGFPARIIVPGLYGFISATKWVERLTMTTYAKDKAYWTKKGWGTDAPIKPSARIDTPKALSTVDGGQDVIIGGVAWAQNDMGAQKVQVQVDGGPWQDATMGPDVNNVYWRQWFHKLEKPDSGQHNVKARVITGDGMTQTDARAEPFPDGSTGLQTLVFSVS